MPTITVPLSDEQWSQLQARAAQRGIAPEELARAAVEELLAHPEAHTEQPEFERAADYVLKKNAELYRRLA